MQLQGNTVQVIDTYVSFRQSQFDAEYNRSVFVDSILAIALATFPAYKQKKNEDHDAWLERINTAIPVNRRTQFRHELITLLSNNVSLSEERKDGYKDFEDMKSKLDGKEVNRAVKTIADDVSRAMTKLHLSIRERGETKTFAKAEKAIELAKALLHAPQAARNAGIQLPKDGEKAAAILRAMANQIKNGKVEGFSTYVAPKTEATA